MTDPQHELPPTAPERYPTLLDRLRGLMGHSRQGVTPQFTCSHLWPNGTSAWTSCVWKYGYAGWAWYSRCQRCGLVARCR